MVRIVSTRNESIIGAVSSIRMFSWSPHVLQDVWAAKLEDKAWMDNFMGRKTSLMVENYRIATSFFREHGIRFCERKVFCQRVEGLIVPICRKECWLVYLDRPSPSTARQAYHTAAQTIGS
ncbi:hypothetical protein AnigIFM63309_006949 [Aspergillus niger]|nr:hypothetical protein AnigIFM63309_006949 [Aspergillus niger]